MANIAIAEYIWMDGAVPTRTIRSKARIIPNLKNNPKPEDFPEWSFDGSSTNQATGDKSDCELKPVCVVKDPIRGEGNYLVMCEVFNADGTPHESNSREQLRRVMDAGAAKHNPWIGFEQEYTLFEGRDPLGWPENGYPGPQGPYYCGVGAEEIYGRDIIEDHTRACIEAGIMIYGINAEVMPGQWEFQIGYRGEDSEDSSLLNIADHTWLARWLLYRVAEDYGIHASTSCKPMKGDWNGAGMHTNFSTTATRDPKNGRQAIKKAVEALSKKHEQHIALYGYGLSERLTGLHETCDINTFRSGVSDRGSSIRIPLGVEQKGYGYFEDRRPGANADPYLVAARLAATVCEIDESVFTFTSWPRKPQSKKNLKAA